MVKVSKKCTKCKKIKSLKDFYKRADGKGKDGYQSHCKSCVCKASYDSIKKNPIRYKEKIEEHKKWRTSKKGKRAVRNYNLKRLCNTTIEDYDKLYNEQQGCCAICGVHQTDLKKSLHQDHNHITGLIRGLLCNNCNCALGLLNTDEVGIELLLQSIEYVERYNV